MRDKFLPVPATISREAQDFIKNTTAMDALSDLASIRKSRLYMRENWQPTAENFAKDLGASWQDIEMAGETVLEVTPAGYCNSKDNKALLYFYGGGYITGSPEEDLPIIAPLATHLGVRVYALRYPLSPEQPFPAALKAASRCYKAMLSLYDPANLLMSGESAGGNLALVTLLDAKTKGLAMPAALALLSPWSDMAALSDSIAVDLDPTISFDSMGKAATDSYVNGNDLFNPLISPLYGDYDADFPPTLITTGTRDFLLGDCARLSTKLRQSGVDVSLHLWEGLWHVFEFYPQLPEAKKSLKEIADFLNSALFKIS
jgi:acetyl esterase/lipase